MTKAKKKNEKKVGKKRNVSVKIMMFVTIGSFN